MKLCDVSKEKKETLRQFAREEVVLLWADGWYDGPLSGMAQVLGNRCLFSLMDANVLSVPGDAEEDRSYWLIQLSDEQRKMEEEWHERFCRNAGTRFDFTGREPSRDEGLPVGLFDDACRNRQSADYGDNEVLGWFRL